MLLAPPKFTPTSLFTAALLAFPALGIAADAQAASAPSVRVTAVSSQVAGGTVSLKVQNRSKAKVAGEVSAKAGKASAGRAPFKVKRRATARIALRLSADAPKARDRQPPAAEPGDHAAWSNYDVFDNEIVFVNCFGTTPFEAVQQ